MKKILSIIKDIFVVLVVLLAIIMMSFTILETTTKGESGKNIFGYKAFIVLTDSMSKTDFKAGDLVIVKNTKPNNLKVGDIISYRSRDLEHYNEVVTHKIRKRIALENGETGFITYGTTTDIDDKEIVTSENILGKYFVSLPKVGTLFQFLKTTPGYIICILLPFLLLILIQAINSIHLFAKYKKETLEEMEEERKKLENERIETRLIKEKLQEAEENSQKMREELEILKKEISKSTKKKKTIAKSSSPKPTTKKTTKKEPKERTTKKTGKKVKNEK